MNEALASPTPEVIPLPASSLLTKKDLILIPEAALAQPIQILSSAMVEAHERAIARGNAIIITDEPSFAAAAEYLNNLTKFSTSIKKSVDGAITGPMSLVDRIKAEGKRFLDPLASFKTLTAQKMADYKTDQDAKRAAAIEAQRQQTERELKERQAKEVERQKLEAQAKAKETQALAQLDSAKTDKAFNAGAEKFDASLALKDQAAAVEVPALPRDFSSKLASPAASAPVLEAAVDEGTEAPAMAAPAASAPVEIIIPKEVKAKGVTFRDEAEILSHDLAKLPIRYHLLNEALLKKHILEGVITVETPGVVFKIKQVPRGTGR